MELPFGIIVRLSERVWTPTLRVTFIQELKHSSMHVVLSWFLVVVIHRSPQQDILRLIKPLA